MNEKADTKFKSDSSSTQRFIKARFADGFTLEDFKKVIDVMCGKWKSNEKMKQYLRPQTLFGTKFESYLNLAPKYKVHRTEKPKAEIARETKDEEPEMSDEEWNEMEEGK